MLLRVKSFLLMFAIIFAGLVVVGGGTMGAFAAVIFIGDRYGAVVGLAAFFAIIAAVVGVAYAAQPAEKLTESGEIGD